jgi:GntR family transcriptional repressor for pyruvate dehydrogenase complex
VTNALDLRAFDDANADAFAPVLKRTLADRLAQRVKLMIDRGDYHEGDRLPTIIEMARRFGVGHPTVREALKKLETMGVVSIRHGAGVFVSRRQELLLVAAPDFAGAVTQKLLVDLIEARIPLETESVALAASHATIEDVAEMQRLLATAHEHLDDDAMLHAANCAFHRQIALASGNGVIVQLLDALRQLFTREQQMILKVFASRERDHREHLGILDAISRRDQSLAIERMRAHLLGVREAVVQWQPERMTE